MSFFFSPPPALRETNLLHNYFFQPVWSYFFSTPSSSFRFNAKNNVVPMSSDVAVFLSMLAYVFVIFSGQWIMKRYKPFELTFTVFLHNAGLSLASFLLMLLIMERVVPRLLKNGIMWGFCAPDSYEADGTLELFYYLNYLFKYYELLDTVFLVLRKKNVEFLHWYHHSMTMLLCYTQLVGRTSVSWVPISLNLSVHVIMYYYYARTTISTKKIWWKKHLTTLQIAQFVIDLLVIFFCMYVMIATDYKHILGPSLPFKYLGLSYCHGTYTAGYFGVGILTSYLLLFVQFFGKTYAQKVIRSGKAKKSE